MSEFDQDLWSERTELMLLTSDEKVRPILTAFISVTDNTVG